MKRLLIFIFMMFLFILDVNAKSINDLYNELDNLYLQRDMNSFLSEYETTELSGISFDIEILIESLNEEVNKINKEILEKENKINEYKEDINNFLVYSQISTGENVYLEYLFNSDSYSELIYKYMIVKQLIDYNNNLIDNLTKEMEELNKAKNSINEKITKLNNEREKFRSLELLLKKNNINSSDSISSSLEEDIISIKKEIELYESYGCDRYSDISLCLNVSNNNYFTFPLLKGCVSNEYEVSVNKIHRGIDLACNKEGTNVYSSASGVVASVVNKSSCGGNIVFIYHNINGKNYTTIYAHLLEIKVVPGQVVNSDSIIGTVGGWTTSYINGGYDKCTNGSHLHYSIVEGFHINNYNIYTLNPRYFNTYPDNFDYFYRDK